MFVNQIEKSAKTVEEALTLALEGLGLSEADVTYEVLDEGAKGFLGFGAREAVVRVTVNETPERKAQSFLEAVLKDMELDAQVQVVMQEKSLLITVTGEQLGILIGKRGQTLDALQYLISLVVNKDRHDYLRVTLDMENYREKRQETLERLAHKLASKVKKTRREVVLEPMNPYERRIIHATLQNVSGINTRSEGEEPYRKVVIYYSRSKA